MKRVKLKQFNPVLRSSPLISLACVSSDTHNLQAVVFLRLFVVHKPTVVVPGVPLAENVETGNKNRCVTEATHVLRRKLRFRDFSERVCLRILSLEALITLKQVNTSVVENKTGLIN